MSQIWAQASALGATHVHTRWVPNQIFCQALFEHLLRQLRPPLNGPPP